jgi:saccharopine dehydrogenase-like NADP-dependent oxidoreductase
MRIGIIGAGKVGRTLALMLHESGLSPTLGDLHRSALPDALAENFCDLDARVPIDLSRFVREHDAVVSAGPFRINLDVARACAEAGVAYLDFTEDTETAAAVQMIAAGKDAPFVPQCGLAPGMVNVIAADLAAQFDHVQSLKLRVGALPQTTGNHIRYYLTWSTAGLVNEYCQPCDALYQGRPIKTMPLEGLETVVIDGVQYEAFNTSGGTATMCETFAGRVDDLTYKSLRYPGHCDKMRFLLHDLQLPQTELEDILSRQLPSTTQDVVVLLVEAVGTRAGALDARSTVRKIFPGKVGDVEATAIERSTAAGMAAVLELLAQGRLPAGFVRQESIPFTDILGTKWGAAVYGDSR